MGVDTSSTDFVVSILNLGAYSPANLKITAELK